MSAITVLAMAATIAAVLVLPTGFALGAGDANPANPFRSFDTPTGTVHSSAMINETATRTKVAKSPTPNRDHCAVGRLINDSAARYDP